MSNRKLLFAFLFSMVFWGSDPVRAQIDAKDYIFFRTVESFIPLENDTALGQGFQDDVLYMNPAQSIDGNTASLSGTGMPIGFTFNFSGVDFTRWAFSSNGYIKLGNGSFTIKNSLSTIFSAAVDSNLHRNVIAGLHGDIMMTLTQGKFSYRTIGFPGSRILVVQYLGVKHWDVSVTSEEIYNFQIRLHEGSNRISIVYGNFLKDAIERKYSVGIKGNFFRGFHTRSLPATATNWNDNIRSTSTTGQMRMDIVTMPAASTCYNFLPRLFDNDLSVSEVIQPVPGVQDCRLSNSETVRFLVKNSGINPQNSASVGYRTSSGQVHTQEFTFNPPLVSEASVEVSMTAPANLGGLFPPELICFVILPGEEEGGRNNDSLKVRFDIGTPLWYSSINSYDSLVNQRKWFRARGSGVPVPGFSLWRQANEFGTFSTAVLMPADSLPQRNEWLLSPGYRVDTSFNYAFSFEAAVTKGLLGIAPIPTIGDDTIKVMYSTDCKQTWKTLKVFNQSDLASNLISNQMKPFQIAIPSSVKEVVHFGLFAKSNSSNSLDTTYRFHFRRLALNRVARFDLSGDTVRLPSVVSLSCKYSTQEPVHLRITNNGFESLDSTRAGYNINNGPVVFKNFSFVPPLLPGQSRTLIFDGPFGADITFPQSYTIKGFVFLTQENIAQRINDTAKRIFQTVSPVVMPSPVYNTFGNLLAARWQRGRGATFPFGPASSWNAKTLNSEQTTGIDFTSSVTQLQDWIYSVSYEGPTLAKFVFKAGVSVAGGTQPVTSMNSDSVRVVYSTDCGASWLTARYFTNADLTSGVLSNRMKEFVFDLANPRGALLVGFQAIRRTGSPSASQFTFHIDSIVMNTPQFVDLAGTGVVLGTNGLITCSGPNPVQLGVIVRNQGSLPVETSKVGYKNNSVIFSKNVSFNPPLGIGKSDTIYFNGTEAPVFSSAGNYQLYGFLELQGENADTRFNDTSGLVSYNILPKLAVPYTQTFPLPTALPVGWSSDTISGKGFKIVAGRGPVGTNALSFRSQSTFNRAQVTTRNFGPITTSAPYLNLIYRTVEQSGAFFRLRPADFIDLLVSTDCGINYVPLARIDSLNQTVAAGFIYKNFDMSAFTGQDVTIRVDAKLTPKPFDSNFLDIFLFSLDGFLSSDPLLEAESVLPFVYPNPVSGRNAGLKNLKPGSRIALSDLNGRLMIPEIHTEGEREISLPLEGLSKGIYLIKIHSPGMVHNLRLIME